MSETFKLPHYFKYGNLNLKSDNFKDEYFDGVFQLFQEGKKDSAGMIRILFIVDAMALCVITERVIIDLFNSRLRDVTNMADFRGKDTPKCIVVNGNNLGF